MDAATWVNCRADFAFDGALVDLLVPGTDPADWEFFWAALRASPFKLRVFRESESIPLPESAAWVFAERQAASVMASVLVGVVTANCHFFGDNVELDIDPREVVNETAFESVLELMRFVAAAVRRPVYAVAEGGTLAFAFLRVSADGQAAFLPSGSVTQF